jgi:hypothetical protein
MGSLSNDHVFLLFWNLSNKSVNCIKVLRHWSRNRRVGKKKSTLGNAHWNLWIRNSLPWSSWSRKPHFYFLSELSNLFTPLLAEQEKCGMGLIYIYIFFCCITVCFRIYFYFCALSYFSHLQPGTCHVLCYKCNNFYIFRMLISLPSKY